MKDTIIKGNGKSKKIKAPSNIPESFAEWRMQLISGTAMLDIVNNTDTVESNAGFDQIGTPLNKETLLTDDTSQALGLTQENPTIDNALYAISQKLQPAELHILAAEGVTVTVTQGSKQLTAIAGSDKWAIVYPAFYGIWKISATINGTLKTQTISIDSAKIYYTSLITLNEIDWTDIDKISQSGMAQNTFKLGDSKKFECYGYTVDAVIIGFDHDSIYGKNKKAGITFQLKNSIVSASMRDVGDTTTDWSTSKMRKTILPQFMQRFPASLQSVIKTVDKYTNDGSASSKNLVHTSDTLFLLSLSEVFTVSEYTGLLKIEEGKQYEFYEAGNSKIKKLNDTNSDWWLRSPYKSGGGDDTLYFTNVTTSGTSNFSNPSTNKGLAFAFCI